MVLTFLTENIRNICSFYIFNWFVLYISIVYCVNFIWCFLYLQLSPDLQIDYESYSWRKLDADSAETKTVVDEYFKWEGNFGGKKFSQGKIFK